MNGAELPCGSILRVEPADVTYQKQQQITPPSRQCAQIYSGKSPLDDARDKADVSQQTRCDSATKIAEESDELDEFFDSL